jgi:hypothetical protein
LKRWSIGLGALAALVTACALALPLNAHVERDPFFVDPAPDTSVLPAAGGRFVDPRPLTDPDARLKAFLAKPRGADALARFARLSAAQQKVALKRVGAKRAKALGLTDARVTAEETIVVCRKDSLSRVRTALGQVKLGKARERRLLALNTKLAKRCRFGEIQPAVNAAGNGDTVVVMPGFYTEPTARKQPHNDPKCASLVDSGSRSTPAPTFEYHVKCPNDLSLIAVIGRDLEGKCVRCNFTLVGSGPRPEDVLVEAGEDVPDPGVTGDLFEEGKGIAKGAKEVGIRLERTDGAVVSNLTVRNTNEHGFYSIEADGVTFDRIKAYYNREYGHLSFVTDHLIVQDGDFAGSGDAGIYPGASPPSGPRLNTIIRRNRSHHNALGVSGSMGSSLHIIDNDFDNNATGITLDSISRAGHPGFPQNSTRIEGNRIFSNNFDTYSDKAWVKSTIQAPIGAGVIFAGGNDNVITDNWIYDNWKWGTVLISLPDVLANDGPKQEDVGKVSTSHRNKVFGNRFGISPKGEKLPNGADHWWDELGEQNCWENNSAPGGIVADPPQLPNCTQFPNIGMGDPVKTRELVDCNFISRGDSTSSTCDWFQVPPKPEPRG